MSSTDLSWEPSRRELERRAVRRQRARRDVTVASAALVVVLGLLAWGITSSPGWASVKESFFNWDQAKAAFPEVIRGFGKNIVIFLVAEPFILVLGAGVAITRSTVSPMMLPFRVLAVVYADVFRGIPTILLVYLAGFGIPALQLTGVTTNTDVARHRCPGAFVRRLRLGGVPGRHRVDPPVAAGERRHAGAVSRWQSMRHVILPQATRRVAPPLLNDFISLQKDTALLSVIFVFEAMFSAQDYNNYNFNYTSLTVAALLFIGLTIPLTRYTDYLGRRALRRQFAGAR